MPSEGAHRRMASKWRSQSSAGRLRLSSGDVVGGLAEHVHAQDGLRDALVLHLGGVLEAAIDDGAEELRLEQEVAEARCVDARVGAAPVSARGGDSG